MSLYVSATVAPWSMKYLGRPSKSSLREALREHADSVEFYVHPTVVSRGGYATLREMGNITEVKVTSDDHANIIGVIVPKVADDGTVTCVVK